MSTDFPKRATEVMDRDPRVFTYGFFSHDTGNGVGMFSWFKDVDEMMEFLLNVEPKIFDIEGESLKDYTKTISEVEKKVKSVGLNEELRSRISEYVFRDFEILWWGTFENLLKDEGDFAKERREGFLSDGEDELLNYNIPEESLEEFIEYLKTCGC